MRNIDPKRNGAKPYSSMSTEELRAATKEYDVPSLSDRLPGRSLSAAQRKVWEKAKARRPGRPKVGKGVRVISMSVERGLLKRADAQAKARGISRSELFAEGLRRILPKAG